MTLDNLTFNNSLYIILLSRYANLDEENRVVKWLVREINNRIIKYT